MVRRAFGENRRALLLPSPRSIARRIRRSHGFKDTAHEHVARVRELVAILEHHGISVRTLKAKRVGYIVYEDEFQIVAEHFGDA